MITGSSIGTLVVFIVSIVFVIHPVSIPLHGHRKLSINLTTAPILAIAILWASQCLGPSVIRDGIVGTDGVKPYNILILFFSLAYMAITLDITGVLEAAAFWVRNKGGSDGYKLFVYFYAMLTGLSVFLGNDPVILSGTAFLVYYTEVTKVDYMSWLISEFAAANTASMVLFVGNPTNVVICEGFAVNNAAFTAYTILPFLGCILACLLALGFQFRKKEHIPRRLKESKKLDVRSVLLDPTGAWVGSVILGTCLIVIIIASFFHVDVWKISLPFAVAKFTYDMLWDHYRWSKGTLIQRPKRQDSNDSCLDKGTSASNGGRDSFEKQHHVGHDIEASPSSTSFAEKSLPSTSGTRVNTRSNTRGTTVTTVTPADESLSSTNRQRHHLDAAGSHSLIENSPLREGETSVPPGAGVTFAANVTIGESGYPASTITTSHTALDTEEAVTNEGPVGEPSNGKGAEHNSLFARLHSRYRTSYAKFAAHFPTIATALPRLPFALVPFAFSQFILIEALTHQGWIQVFSTWLVRASKKETHPVIWLVGVLGVILCNISGTNIGATILLTKVVRAADLTPDTNRAAAISLAVASNIGAVSFTYSASLAGLLWRAILKQKGIFIKQKTFAYWNSLPLIVMTAVGLAIVSAEMAVLYRK